MCSRSPAVTFAALYFVFPVGAHGQSSTVDDLLADGWHRYSEELDFEGAVTAYQSATEHPEATDEQKLEAYEYLAACRFALGNQEAARLALIELLRINPEQQLNDPSHSPDLLQLLEDLREEGVAEPPPPLPPPPPEEDEQPPGLVTTQPNIGEAQPDGPGEGEETEEGGGQRRRFYRTWWCWTVIGVVVASTVTDGEVVAFAVICHDQVRFVEKLPQVVKHGFGVVVVFGPEHDFAPVEPFGGPAEHPGRFDDFVGRDIGAPEIVSSD